VFRLFIIRHTPRAVVVISLLLPIILWPLRGFVGLNLPTYVLTTGAVLLIAARHTADWNRVYDTD